MTKYYEVFYAQDDFYTKPKKFNTKKEALMEYRLNSINSTGQIIKNRENFLLEKDTEKPFYSKDISPDRTPTTYENNQKSYNPSLTRVRKHKRKGTQGVRQHLRRTTSRNLI